MVVSTRSVKLRLPSVILEAVSPSRQRQRRKKKVKRRFSTARSSKKNVKMIPFQSVYEYANIPTTLGDDFSVNLRPTERQRMKPWLVDQVESGEIQGLAWQNKERTMVRIPWKHAAQNSWKMGSDACLFKRWAIHTGKHRDGKDSPSPKRWKANFRCALNSLPDVIEVPTMGKKKGSDAFKIYKLCQDKQEKQRLKRVYRGQTNYSCEGTDSDASTKRALYARRFSDPSHSANHVHYKACRPTMGKPAAYTKHLESNRQRSLSAPGREVKEENSFRDCPYSGVSLADHDYTASQGDYPLTVTTFNTALNSGGQLYDTTANGAGTTYNVAIRPYINLKKENQVKIECLPPTTDNTGGENDYDSSDNDSNLTDEQVVEMIDEMERTSSPGCSSSFDQQDSWQYTEADGGKEYYVNSTVCTSVPSSFSTTTEIRAKVMTQIHVSNNGFPIPALEVEVPAGELDVNLSIGENILENSQYSTALPTTMANSSDDFVTLTAVQADNKHI